MLALSPTSSTSSQMWGTIDPSGLRARACVCRTKGEAPCCSLALSPTSCSICLLSSPAVTVRSQRLSCARARGGLYCIALPTVIMPVLASSAISTVRGKGGRGYVVTGRESGGSTPNTRHVNMICGDAKARLMHRRIIASTNHIYT